VVGGGQAGLALGYHLRREGVPFRILDAGEGPGGAWPHTWPSLRLFSPARYSSLPGWLMPGGEDDVPFRDEVVDYLGRYEARYELPVERPVRVAAVHRAGEGFRVETDRGAIRTRVVLGATGTWENPVLPHLPGEEAFEGRILHSAHYRGPDGFLGARVAVVGGGNSGAQILADLQGHAGEVRWLVEQAPAFLPDDVDGRVLFERATARIRARQEGRPPPPAPGGLGQVVMVPPVCALRDRGLLRWEPTFDWYGPDALHRADGSRVPADAVIWATGFRPALACFRPLGILDGRGRVRTEGSRVLSCPGLWLVGYGDWTGPASATLIGVGRHARAAAREVARYLERG
jgi:putative flavoprotein involved in K+ transport